jgi:hypothetical protein
MKKIISSFSLLLVVVPIIKSQCITDNFDASRPCQINVNTNYVNFNSRDNTKRATVRYSIPGQGRCTGTLINTTTNRQFLLTAAHCLKDLYG